MRSQLPLVDLTVLGLQASMPHDWVLKVEDSPAFDGVVVTVRHLTMGIGSTVAVTNFELFQQGVTESLSYAIERAVEELVDMLHSHAATLTTFQKKVHKQWRS